MQLPASCVLLLTASCASSKCGEYPIEAKYGGTSTVIGSCNGSFGTTDATSPLIADHPLTITVGERLEFAYRHGPDPTYPHGGGVSDASVTRVEASPRRGSGIVTVVGVAPGSSVVTVNPTAYCGGMPGQRCVLAVVDVVAK